MYSCHIDRIMHTHHSKNNLVVCVWVVHLQSERIRGISYNSLYFGNSQSYPCWLFRNQDQMLYKKVWYKQPVHPSQLFRFLARKIPHLRQHPSGQFDGRWHNQHPYQRLLHRSQFWVVDLEYKMILRSIPSLFGQSRSWTYQQVNILLNLELLLGQWIPPSELNEKICRFLHILHIFDKK